MKGRARERDSKFIFLCSLEQYEETCQEKQGFDKVIKIMQEKVSGLNEAPPGPDKDIVLKKLQSPDDYLRIYETGARVSMRDSKQIIDIVTQAIRVQFGEQIKAREADNKSER